MMKTIKQLKIIADDSILQGKYAWKAWTEIVNNLSPIEKMYVLEHVKFRLAQLNKMKDAKHQGYWGMQRHSYHGKD